MSGTTRAQFDADYRISESEHTEALNLDDMDRWDLDIAKDHPALCSLVRRYATLKAEAIDLRTRRKKNISQAGLVEAECEMIYRSMPASIQW